MNTQKKSDSTLAVVSHLSGFIGFVIPFGNIIVPALIMILKGKEDEFVEKHAKEALNFQISVTIYYLVAGVLSIILIGIPLLFAILIVEIIQIIKACQAAQNGKTYSYPFTLRFVK